MSYRNLEVWQLAKETAIGVHAMTLKQLPKFEPYEMGSQIRRSVKSVRANIVEGYGRRRYKAEFEKHLVYALASCDETTDHLETLFEPNSLTDQPTYERLHAQLQLLGKKLNVFLQSIERGHRSEK
jgi:four helix bundle protein